MTRMTCYHEHKQLVWSDIDTHLEKLLVRQLRFQCGDCGRLLSDAIAHSRSTPSTPEVDREAVRKWHEHDKSMWAKKRTEGRELKAEVRIEQTAEYQKYLQSDAWREKRRRVMKRANFLCEGCGDVRATEVHHLTYANIYNEFLWQLVAVCRDCHGRVHGREDRERDTAGQSDSDEIKRAG